MKRKRPKQAKKPPQPTHRPIVGFEKRSRLLAILIRSKDALLAVHEQLLPEHFDDTEMSCALVWHAARKLFAAHGELPKKKILLAEINDIAQSCPEQFPTEEILSAEELVEDAFADKAPAEAEVQWAVATAKNLLEDLLSAKVRATVHTSKAVPIDLPGMLSALNQQANTISGLQTRPSPIPFPKGWDTAEAPKLRPTGISTFDVFLGGGHRDGEVYLFMGPYGSCKTTVAVQAQVEGAKAAAAMTSQSDWDGRIPLSVLNSYEMTKDEWQVRALSCAASIPRNIVEEMAAKGGLNYLSTADSLRDYERILFKRQLDLGEPVLGERERAEKAIKLLNQYALFIDMTGSDPSRRGAGNGYVPEIARVLDSELRSRKNAYAIVVWVDYLGAMSKRHLEVSEYTLNDLRHMLSGGVLQLSTLVAKPFKCPVWANHQLSGQANSRMPAARMHHTDAAEAKNVAENADFAIVAGNLNEKQLCVVACTKHRRQPPRESAIIQVQGEFSRIADVSREYAVEPYSRQIMSKAQRDGLKAEIEDFSQRNGVGLKHLME